MAREQHWNACINRLYYACFYGVSALLFQEGLMSSKHAGVRTFFGQHFVKTGRIERDVAVIFNELFDWRQQSDYEDFFTIGADLVHNSLERAQSLLETIDGMIQEQ